MPFGMWVAEFRVLSPAWYKVAWYKLTLRLCGRRRLLVGPGPSVGLCSAADSGQVTPVSDCRLCWAAPSSGHVFGWRELSGSVPANMVLASGNQYHPPLVTYTVEFMFSCSCYGNKCLPSDRNKMLVSVLPSHEGCSKVERKRKGSRWLPPGFR